MRTRFRNVPLWSIWIVPFVAQLFVAVGLVGYLSFKNGKKAVNDLAGQLMDKTTQQVNDHLDVYLALPLQLTQINAQAIASGDLDIRDRSASGRYFWRQAQAFKDLAYLGYSLTDGSEVGAGQWIQGLGVILSENFPGENNTSDYLTDANGLRGQRLQTYEYEPTTDVWYKDAVAAGKLTWTRIYAAQSTNITATADGTALQTKENIDLSSGLDYYVAISASAPVYDAQGRLLGVTGTDLLLNHISEFLQGLRLSNAGQIFIVGQDGLLISSSTSHPIVYQKGDALERYSISESPDPLIRAIAPHLQSKLQQNSSNHQSQEFEVFFEGQHYFGQTTDWHDEEHGLDWIVVMAVPESDIMAQINANTRQTILLCLAALGVATLVGIRTSRWVTRPIQALYQASQSIAKGDLGQHVDHSAIKELDSVGQSFNRMAAQLQESFDQLDFAANRDALTGLPNRAAIQRKLTEAISRCSCHLQDIAAHDGVCDPSSHPFAVLFLDLDFFKLVNDSLGHLAGDQLLIEVTHRLRNCVRNQDTVSRFGGDEFVVLLEPIDTPIYAIQVAERIIQELKKPFLLNDKTAFISTSIGIVFGSTSTADAESILRNADIALYRAKSNGKSVYEVFDDAMHVEVVERLQLETDLHHVLRDGQTELNVYYQPVVDAYTLQVVGLEALVRWQHPTLGMVSPAKFIPIAEETGLIVQLDYWVLRQACRQMQKWQQQFPQTQPCTISVNLSTRQFLQPDLAIQIARILLEENLAPGFLKLEITESLLISNRALMQTQIEQLRTLGVQLSLDDFGTGYSSLSYLHHFQLDTLKIDRSFIRQATSEGQNLSVIESITALAHKLGMNVVAEGVETQEQLDYLRNIARCEQIQGFLIAPAMPADRLDEWMCDRATINSQTS